MTAQPAGQVPGQDTGSYEVIHLGDQAAVVVPLGDFMRLSSSPTIPVPPNRSLTDPIIAGYASGGTG